MRQRASDSFRVDEDGFTADGYRRLQPESKKSMYVVNVIAMVVIAAILLTAAHFSDVMADGSPVFEAAMYIITAAVVVYCLAEPQVLYRRYRYRMDDDKIEVRKGIIYITHIMVPVERVHQVDVVEGPVNRMFGLADVIITTAGGVVSIEYLEAEVAQSIAGKLNDKVVSMLKERV